MNEYSFNAHEMNHAEVTAILRDLVTNIRGKIAVLSTIPDSTSLVEGLATMADSIEGKVSFFAGAKQSA